MKPTFTRRFLITCFVIASILTLNNLQAQVSNYQFSQSVGVYTPITGGVVLGNSGNTNQRFTDPAAPSGSTADTGPGFPIGFNFAYNGVNFTQIGVHTKGWVSLGTNEQGVNMAATNIATPLSSSAFIAPSYLRSRIAAVGTNLQAQTGSELRIETIGAAPNRVCVVQWTNYRVGLQTGLNLSFQLRLHETTHTIQVVFGAMTFNATTNQADVGLGGFWANDVNNRRTISPHNWNNTLAGINNTSRCTFNTSTTPPTGGRTYTWTPAGCQLPYLFQVADFTASSGTIEWYCANCTGSFIVEYGPPDFEPGTGATAGAQGAIILASGSPATITGLEPLTYYDVYVRQDCGDGLYSLNSGPLSFSTRPPNDDVCNALPLNVGVNGAYPNQFASVQPAEPAPPALNCDTQNAWCPDDDLQNSLWFTFSPTQSGVYNIQAFGYDVQAALYFANTCNELLQGSAILLAANDNGSQTQPGGALLTNLCLAAGRTYYLQTDGYQSAVGNVTIEVSFLGAVPPATLTCPPNTTASAGFTACEVFVSIPLPTVDGICGNYTFTNNYTQTANASAVYPVGATTVTYTLADLDNPTTCSFTVTVTNPLPVSVTCQNITVSLNQSGFAGITPQSVFVDATSCSTPINPVSVFPNAFTCAQLGSNTVTLTATDAAGATATCQSTVLVADDTPPTAQCQPNITLSVNAQGTATLLPNAVNNNSTDNCSITQLSVFPDVFTCANTGQNTVTLTLTDASGNTAACQTNINITDQTPPTAQCLNIAVQLNEQGQATITPAMVNNNSADNCAITNLAVLPTQFTCIDTGIASATLTATDAAGNTGSCLAQVTVSDATPPIAQCQPNVSLSLNALGIAAVSTELINNNSTDNCFLAQFTVFPTQFTCNNLQTANTVTLTATDQSGNTATCTTQITLADNIPPIANCQNAAIILTQNGTATLPPNVVNNNSSDNCGITQLSVFPDSFTCSNLGQNNVVLTVTDTSGNTDTCQSSIAITDNLPPQALCQNTSVTLNLSGNATITPAQINNNSTDNCILTNLSVFPDAFTCSNIGQNTVTLTATDQSGNTATCQATVTVIFNAPTQNLCQDITVWLNAAGTATVLPVNLFNPTADNCAGFTPQSATPHTFTCANLGQNTVTLTLANSLGNTASCTAVVTVLDTLPPTAQCQNIPVQLNEQGQASITAAMINNGSADNCNIVQQTVFPDSFTCANIGQNTVTLTLTDSSGNTAACTALVTVSDNILPVAQCQGFSVNIDQTGIINLLPQDINNGSTDNCALTNFAVSPDVLTCANIGANTITLTITDQGGNTATCSATVNVIFSPQNAQLCQNITVNLNNQGTAAIIPADVFLGGGNECGGFNPLSVTPHSFTCSSVGANTVTLTVSDIGGATTTCSATVTIADTTPPNVQCQNTSVFLDQNGAITLGVAQINNGTTDNCTLQNLAIEPAVLTCEQLGSATVTLTATDQSGNTATCAATVLVTDAIAPTLSCNNATVAINISGSVSITPQSVISSAADNCGIVFTEVLPHTFTCANVGSNTIVATVADAQGNTATCSAVVNVLFNAPPELLCQEATVNLGATGTATIAPVDVFAGSPDDCSLLIPVSVSPSVVTCAQLSGTTVTLTVSDTGGNTTTCSANITVADTTPPTAQCQNTLVNLNDSGTATLTLGMVNNNSFDNCSIGSLSVFPEQFTCANLGSNTVTLTATDQSGNTATCQATVTVADNLAPTITCANTTLEITTQNSVSVLPTMITGSAADNCGINTTSVLPNTFTCQNVGNNTVTLTVTDTSGNTSTCSATVSVLFNPPPVSVCQPASVSLFSNGTATLSPMSVFAGGSDVCGLLSPVLVNPALFTCANLGSNTVTLTVANAIGFTYTCQTTVSVTDNLPPTAQCQNALVNLNGSGTATLTAGMVNNNSFDNCSIGSLSVFPEQFTCANLGNNTITLTATDQSGNSSTCNATLLVADVVPPQVSCADISVDITATGSATITPASVTASASDNCQVSGFSLSATTFNCANVGSNTITLTATDQSGNTATCQAQVTVVFNPPVITSLCQNYAVNLNQSGTAAILPVNVFGGGADLCGGITPVSVLPHTFTCANVGSNTVTLTTVNSVGNSSTCSATVTVTDQIPPQITCPPNINTGTQPGLCGANLTIAPPTPADNCSIIAFTNSVTGNANAGGFYPGGITTVVYTAVDASGNTATCSFNINITDTEPPVFTCPPDMVKSAADCFEPFNWTTPTASDNCGVVSVLPDSPSGSLFGIGATTITYTATDVWGNTATCSFTATLNDVTPPDLVCPQNINLSTQGQTCQATATWAVPSPTDNCSAVSLTNASHMPGAIFNTGTVTVSYAAADSWNNTSSCAFTITVADTTPPFIDCPGNKTLPTTPGTCHAFVQVDDFFASDNCGALTVVNNINGTDDAGGIYQLGTTTVTYLATDAVGNTNICTFNITIFDAQAPAVTCPANVVQPLSGTNCFAIVTVPPATATDNCLGNVALSNSLTGTANASGAYLVGVTTVTYTAADVAGNTATCNFTVSVLEQTPPVIAACPPNITKPVVAGACSATATWNTPIATDNCSVVTLSVSVPSGSSFNTGVSTVTYTATDASGNTATCAFTVTVLDPNPPAITCPANMVSCSTFPFWPSATATDDCLVIGVVANKPQGAYMVPGINTVTFTATDASGNTATCTFSINVAPPLNVILSSSNFGGNNVTCHGASTGIINGVAFGGVSPYSFQWSNGATNNILTGLPAGSYTATVTDALGCTGANSITLTQPPPIVCSMTTSPATCAGVANGSASVSVLGLGAYNYTWSGPSGALPPTATVNNLLPGTYHVTVTNPLGCTCVASGTVNSGTATTTLTGNMTTTSAAPPVIFNSSAITFTGGSAPYTFSWITVGYVQYSASNTGITVIYSGSAFWSVTVSDNNPCTIGELVFSNAPDVNTQILTIVSANVTSDSGGSNGSITLTVAGGNPCAGTAPYQYNWQGPSNWLPVGNTNTPNLTGLPSGWYIVQVKDCGPDGVPNTGDEQTVFAYYWVTKQVRGRGKQPDMGLQVFPNPTKGAFTMGVLLASPEPFNIGLYDFTGRYLATLHQQIEPNQISQTTVAIDLPPHLPDGLYIVQLTTASGYSVQQKLFVAQNK